MGTRIFIMLLFVVSIISCKSGKTPTAEELEKLNTIAEMDTLTIEFDSAYPLSASIINNSSVLLPQDSRGGTINLIGNYNHFKILGDSLSISLPYFGERQMGGGYNLDDAGIKFEGKPLVTKHSYNSKKHKQEYYFEVKKGSETFQMNLSIFSNLNTDLRVTSTHRTAISYRGNVLLNKKE